MARKKSDTRLLVEKLKAMGATTFPNEPDEGDEERPTQEAVNALKQVAVPTIAAGLTRDLLDALRDVLGALDPRNGAQYQKEYAGLVTRAQRELTRPGLASIAGNSGRLAAEYVEARTRKKALDLEAAGESMRVSACEQLMWDAFESDGIESIRTADGAPVSVYDEVTVKVVDRAALNAWALANGLGPKMTLYASTVSSTTKEKLIAGEQQPDGVVVGTYKRTRLA